MAADNKSLGRFILDGIAPAPRWVPQVEVTFDIDANWVLNVTAKDKGTGKEQKITIQGSTGMSDDEVDALVKEAEANREADKKKKEAVEARNMADSTIVQADKMIKENEEKISEENKKEVTEKIEALKKEKAKLEWEVNELNEEKGVANSKGGTNKTPTVEEEISEDKKADEEENNSSNEENSSPASNSSDSGTSTPSSTSNTGNSEAKNNTPKNVETWNKAWAEKNNAIKNEKVPEINCIWLPWCQDTDKNNPKSYNTVNAPEWNFVTKYLSNFVSKSIWYVAAIWVIALMISWIFYVTSWGDEEKASKAKKWITWILTWVVISLLALTVITMIDNLKIKVSSDPNPAPAEQ